MISTQKQNLLFALSFLVGAGLTFTIFAMLFNGRGDEAVVWGVVTAMAAVGYGFWAGRWGVDPPFIAPLLFAAGPLFIATLSMGDLVTEGRFEPFLAWAAAALTLVILGFGGLRIGTRRSL